MMTDLLLLALAVLVVIACKVYVRSLGVQGCACDCNQGRRECHYIDHDPNYVPPQRDWSLGSAEKRKGGAE